jgi:hypothetical protein
MSNTLKTLYTIGLYLLVTLSLVFLYSCNGHKEISVNACPVWADNIHNPDNQEFVEEVAFNLDIPPAQVTQQMFDERYGSH